MDLFRYVYCIESDEKVCLINLVNGVVISLTKSTYKKVLKREFNKISKDDLSILKKRGFLIESKYNNFNITFEKYAALNLNLTNDCNFDCDYCYFKANNKEKVSLSIDENKLLSWIDDFIIPKGCNIYINFLGGEPLIEVEKLLNISNSIKKVSMRNSINYFGEVTTNGYYLTPKIATTLSQAGIKTIQITLDGEKEEHNRTRCCKNGMPTYDIIIRNICDCMHIIPITIRINIYINMDMKTISTLLQDLKKVGIKKIYFSCIERNYGENNVQNIYALTDDKALERYIAAWTLQKQFGFDFVQKIPAIMGNCIAINTNGYTINYDGKMFLCPSACGITKFLIDDLYDFKANRKNEKKILTHCKKCVLFPLCMGGCELTNSFVDKKKWCRKKHLEDLLKNYYKLKYSL